MSTILSTYEIMTGHCSSHARHEVQAQSTVHKHFGEIAIELGFASEWTVHNALRLQQRGRGETPAAPAAADPWGNSPL